MKDNLDPAEISRMVSQNAAMHQSQKFNSGIDKVLSLNLPLTLTSINNQKCSFLSFDRDFNINRTEHLSEQTWFLNFNKFISWEFRESVQRTESFNTDTKSLHRDDVDFGTFFIDNFFRSTSAKKNKLRQRKYSTKSWNF